MKLFEIEAFFFCSSFLFKFCQKTVMECCDKIWRQTSKPNTEILSTHTQDIKRVYQNVSPCFPILLISQLVFECHYWHIVPSVCLWCLLCLSLNSPVAIWQQNSCRTTIWPFWKSRAIQPFERVYPNLMNDNLATVFVTELPFGRSDSNSNVYCLSSQINVC